MEQNVLFRKVPIEILKAIKKKPMNATRVSIECDVTFAWAYSVIEVLYKEGIVRKENADGRSKVLFLTDKGEKILDLMEKIQKEMGWMWKECKKKIM